MMRPSACRSPRHPNTPPPPSNASVLSTPFQTPNGGNGGRAAQQPGLLAQLRQGLPDRQNLDSEIRDLARRMVALEEELSALQGPPPCVSVSEEGALQSRLGAAEGGEAVATASADEDQADYSHDGVEVERAPSPYGASQGLLSPAAGAEQHVAEAGELAGPGVLVASPVRMCGGGVQTGMPQMMVADSGSDLDDLVSPQTSQPKKHRTGFWGWLTGQDVVSY